MKQKLMIFLGLLVVCEFLSSSIVKADEFHVGAYANEEMLCLKLEEKDAEKNSITCMDAMTEISGEYFSGDEALLASLAYNTEFVFSDSLVFAFADPDEMATNLADVLNYMYQSLEFSQTPNFNKSLTADVSGRIYLATGWRMPTRFVRLVTSGRATRAAGVLSRGERIIRQRAREITQAEIREVQRQAAQELREQALKAMQRANGG